MVNVRAQAQCIPCGSQQHFSVNQCLVIVTMYSPQRTNSRVTPDPEDLEVVVQQELVIPVLELKATIS